MVNPVWQEVDSRLDESAKYRLLLLALKGAATTNDTVAVLLDDFADWLDKTPFDQLEQAGYADRAARICITIYNNRSSNSW